MTSEDEGLGKVERDFLSRVLLKNTGARNGAVVVGPGMGMDNAVLSVGDGRVMVITADPLSMIPSIGLERSAWLTVHELASDLTTSAVRPQFAVLDYNIPPALGMDDFEVYAKAVSSECRRLGVSILGGHTGRYPGGGFSIVGGGMMMGLSEEGAYLTPKMMMEGDSIIMTKGAAIEATAVLSLAFPQRTERAVGSPAIAEKARSYISLCSTVQDALAASSTGIREGGVTSMHDATEGGVLGGLFELARSGGHDLWVDKDLIYVTDEASAVCRAFGLDPLTTLSEGALLITCRPDRSDAVFRAIYRAGAECYILGRVGGRASRRGRLLLRSSKTKPQEYVPPKFDPYWTVYAEGVRKAWK